MRVAGRTEHTGPPYIHAVPGDGGVWRHKDTQSRAIQRAGRVSSHSALREGRHTPGTSSSGRPLLPSHIHTQHLLSPSVHCNFCRSGSSAAIFSPVHLFLHHFREPHTGNLHCPFTPARRMQRSPWKLCSNPKPCPPPQEDTWPADMQHTSSRLWLPGHAGTPMFLVWAWG